MARFKKTKNRYDKVSRRLFLRGTGVGLALPALEWAMPRSAHAAAVSPKRLVAINIPLGFYGPSFFPTESGTDYAMPETLKAAEGFRKHFTLISGTSHPGVDGGHSAEKSFLTCAPHPGSRSFKNTISLDQWIAGKVGEATRFASMSLGDHNMAWSANGVSIPAERSPSKAYAQLFLRGKDREVAEQKHRLQDGQSIMDTVLDEARSLENTVSKLDREKLDQYFTAVRETERRLTKEENWVDTPKPAVNEKSPGAIKSEDLTGRLAAHFQVIRLALQTDSTRVVTLGGDGGSQVPPLPGVDTGYHGLSHHGKNPAMIEQLKIIDRETVRVWSEFVQDLLKTPEGNGSLLDQTQVLFGSNLGNASGHITTNLPIILAGGSWKHGHHLAFDAEKNYPLPNLFVSLLQGMGFETDQFASGTGTLRGLERAASDPCRSSQFTSTPRKVPGRCNPVSYRRSFSG